MTKPAPFEGVRMFRALVPTLTLLAALPAAAQQDTVVTVTLTSRNEAVAAQTGVPVSAYQVYLACRHPSAIRRNTQDAVAARLNAFCRRGLPAPGAWLSNTEVTAWLDSIPDPTDIRIYADSSAALERRAIDIVTLTSAQVEGNDESRGLIRFASDDDLDLGDTVNVAAVRERLSQRLRTGPAAAVLVRGYPDSRDSRPNVARDRAEAVRARLMSDSILGKEGVVWAEAWTPVLSTRYPPDNYYGRVSVHLLYPPRPAPALTSLTRVRFPVDGDALDSEDGLVLTQVAGELLAANLPPGYPIIITGYAEFKRNDDAQERVRLAGLARRRAEAIRGVLGALLQEHGISAEQMVVRGELVQEGTAAAAAVSDSAAAAAISLGNLPAASVALPVSTPEGRAAASGLLSVEGIASAAAAVLVERAERQVQTYVFQLVAAEVCGGYASLLPQTCSMLYDSLTRAAAYQLSVANLQQLVRSDFEALPLSLLTRALVSRYGAEQGVLRTLAASGGNSLTPDALAKSIGDLQIVPRGCDPACMRLAVDQALAAAPGLVPVANSVRDAGGWALLGVYGLEFVRRVSNGDPVVETALGFQSWIENTFKTYPVLGYLSTSAPVFRVQQFASFVHDADAAVHLFRRNAPQALSADTVYLYALRTALVNRQSERKTIAGYASYVVQARRHLDRATVIVDSLRGQLRAVRGTGEAAVQLRRELYTLAVGELAGSFYTLLMNEQLTPLIRDSIARIATPVRNLFYALQAGDMRGAFTETVALLPRVLPPVATADSCVAGGGEGCTRLVLIRECG